MGTAPNPLPVSGRVIGRKRKTWPWALSAIAVVVVIAGGYFFKNLMAVGGVSDQKVQEFHHALDSGSCDTTYTAASPELQASTTREKWQSLCNLVTSKMGSYKSSTRTFIQEKTSGSGNMLIVEYDSEFSQGSAHEQFTWRLRDSQLTLLGYHINSSNFVP